MLDLIIFILFIILWWYYNDRKSYGHYPPGPVRHPLIGNLLQIGRASKIPPVALHKLSQKYGDVMHVRMGVVDMIIVDSHSAVMDFFHNKSIQSIAHLKYVDYRNNGEKDIGIIFANNEAWQTLRRYTIRTLRDFGFGKSTMSAVIQEEGDNLINHIKSHNSQVVNNVEKLFDLPVINVLWRLVTGKSFQKNDPQILKLLHLSHEWFRIVRMDDIAMSYPVLLEMFPNWSGKNTQIHTIQKLVHFVEEVVEEFATTKNSSMDSFIDCFLSEIGRTHFTKKQLVYVVLDLFQAGNDTTSNTLSFAMLYLILFPEVQEKVHQELDSVNSDDKLQLPYTHATLLEIMRFSSLAPLPACRAASEDFTFRGYSIKKGTLMMVNIQGVHFDKRLWGDPENFRPERFLTNGIINREVADQMIAFAAGKRVCLGQALAEQTSFAFITTILRNFTLKVDSNNKRPSLEPELGFTYTPMPFNCCFIPRSSIHGTTKGSRCT